MRSLLAVLAFVLVGGCAVLQPGADQAVAVDGIVGEALVTSRANAAEQKLALSRAQRKFMEEPAAVNRLRLATLLATLSPGLRDDARATELLEPIADAGAPGIGRFAALLAAQIAERQRLAREIDRLSRERGRIDKEREQADKERDKREEALRQQLEALRSIERGILEREDRLRRKQR